MPASYRIARDSRSPLPAQSAHAHVLVAKDPDGIGAVELKDVADDFRYRRLAAIAPSRATDNSAYLPPLNNDGASISTLFRFMLHSFDASQLISTRCET